MLFNLPDTSGGSCAEARAWPIDPQPDGPRHSRGLGFASSHSILWPGFPGGFTSLAGGGQYGQLKGDYSLFAPDGGRRSLARDSSVLLAE